MQFLFYVIIIKEKFSYLQHFANACVILHDASLFEPRSTRFYKSYLAKHRYAFVTINTFLKCLTRRKESRLTVATVHLRWHKCTGLPAFPRHCVCIRAHNAPTVCGIRLSTYSRGTSGTAGSTQAHNTDLQYMQYVPLRRRYPYTNKCV